MPCCRGTQREHIPQNALKQNREVLRTGSQANRLVHSPAKPETLLQTSHSIFESCETFHDRQVHQPAQCSLRLTIASTTEGTQPAGNQMYNVLIQLMDPNHALKPAKDCLLRVRERRIFTLRTFRSNSVAKYHTLRPCTTKYCTALRDRKHRQETHTENTNRKHRQKTQTENTGRQHDDDTVLW